MRIVFMGTPQFAAVCLDALADSHHRVLAVVTQPDRPSGRGKHLTPPPVKETAIGRGLEVLQPKKIRDAETFAYLAELLPDIFVVAAYGQFLPQRMLDMPKYGAINVHASLLPKYRGASPIQQAIADGENVTGITIIQMAKGIDTGDMLLKAEVAITADDTGGTLHDKLCEIAPFALLDALDLIDSGQVMPIKQDNELATYAPLIAKDMAQIDWQKQPSMIVNSIRAYNPFPGAFTELGGHLIKIWQAEVSNQAGKPGEILQACPKDGIVVAANGGAVRILLLTPPGGKKMSAADFVKGYKIMSF